MDLYQTTNVDLAVLWPHIDHLVKDVCRRSRGDITPESFRRAVETGEAQLWVIADPEREGSEKFRAILGTRLAHVMSGMKVCNIILCAGEGRKEWVHLIYKLADWARSEGCEKFSILARRGWVRDLTMFKVTANEMEMDLTHAGKNRDDHRKQDRPVPLAHASY